MILTRAFAAAAAALTLSTTAIAQNYPSKPITVIIPYSVGGTTDIVARLVTTQIGNNLGQALIAENRVGGGGQIGWSAAARSAPDGYTLLTTEMSFTIAPGLLPKLPFDSRKDFSHVITAAAAPHVLVIDPGVPAKTVQEFVALAKAKPGSMNYGSGGNGTNTHLGGELFKSAAGVDLLHVPYKGAGQVLTDLMAGQVQALVTSLPTALSHIKSGKLRALVVTGDTRSPLLPDVPSAKEANLPSFVMDFWVGFAAPAGTPAPIIEKLNHAIATTLTSSDGKRRLAEQGLTPVANTPVQASQLAAAEMQRWAAIIKSAGIKAE
jgi:tripartite-type tricarboxylate transporter receptor subunit TctC